MNPDRHDNILITKVLDALQTEQQVASRARPFKATDVISRGYFVTLELTPTGKSGPLDESAEESWLSWETSQGGQGSAEIISVLPEFSIVYICLEKGVAPRVGQPVFLHPPRFLDALLALWRDPVISVRAAKWFNSLGQHPSMPLGLEPAKWFPNLRKAQRQAFALLDRPTAFLWGPPGTGKTYTVGRLVAGLLAARADARVLLLSSTNVAVDLATVEVANAAKEAGLPQKRLYRFGARLDPARFHDRTELVPLRDRTLVAELKKHLQEIPSTADPQRYAAWKARRNDLQQRIDDENRHFLSSARLVAMTTSLAAREYRNLGRFDLVLFDEASQVNKVHAVTYAPLGRRILFAGDSCQLSPIAQSAPRREEVNAWLQSSPLVWKDRADLRESLCFLDEQSRMAPAICGIVSQAFYQGRLRVANELSGQPDWHASRQPEQSRLIGADPVVLLRVSEPPRPAPGFRGYQCEESALYTLALAAEYLRSVGDSADATRRLMLLTPFVAQRRRFQAELQSWGWPTKLASTVHRAQGSEADVIIFDPVAPESEFVSSSEGQRLFNVAMSRAKCRLVILCHPGWTNHPILCRVARSVPLRGLDKDLVDRQLASPPKPATAPPKPSSLNPSPSVPLTLKDQFVAELLREAQQRGWLRSQMKELAQDLRGRAVFQKLSWAEVDQALAEVANTQTSHPSR